MRLFGDLQHHYFQSDQQRCPMTKSSMAGIFIAVFAVSCFAAEISKEDLNFFLEESYSRYNNSNDAGDIEDQFFRIARKSDTPGEAIEAFAKSLGVPQETAGKYAQALIEACKFREKCDRRSGPCKFQPGEPAYDALVDAGFADLKGDIAFSIGTNLCNSTPPEAKIAFVRAIMKHPHRGEILTSLYKYSEDSIFGSVLFTLEPPTVRSAALLRRKAYRDGYALSNDQGVYISLAEIAREKAQSLKGAEKETVYLTCTEALIWTQLWAGLTDRALHVYNKLPHDLRERIPTSPAAELKNEDRRAYAQESASLASDLAFALYLSGDAAAARRMLEKRTKLVQFENVETTGDEEFRALALEEAMAPKYSADELYNLYFLGNAKDEPEQPAKGKERGWSKAKGWFFSIGESLPAMREVGAQRLKAAGYSEMAARLMRQERYYSLLSPLPDLGDMLPKIFADRQTYWELKTNQAREIRQTRNARKKAEPSGILCHTPNPLRVEERKVPPELRRPAAVSGNIIFDQQEPRIPEGVDLPVNKRSVVRYAKENGEKMIVFLSGELDHPGEIPAYGFWFEKTHGGGREWERPLYLNLQQHFPYVVVPDSKIPMLSEGNLQIEVEIKEIDPRSISFPPVGLVFKREERDLYIVINLADIEKDSDGDGLTDVIEHRIGLCPDNPDTDGDGIQDGSDPLPLTAFNPHASAESKQVAAAILSKTQKYEKGAIIVAPHSSAEAQEVCSVLGLKTKPADKAKTTFLIADPEIFSGILLPDRLLLYREGEMESLGDSNAPFFAPQIEVFPNKSRTKFYVIWTAGWTGGEFIVCREGDEYKVKVKSEWIT
jgi:hypothetical protein